jgi:hypothetical protein
VVAGGRRLNQIWNQEQEMAGGLSEVTDSAKRLAPHHHGGRSKLLSTFNSLGGLFPQIGVSFLTLEVDALLEKACERTGLHDFNDDSLPHRLEILLQSFKSDAHLNLIGRICVHSDILRLLCNRLRLEEDRKRHPEIAAQMVRRPLFITGLPRTGSTLLHALLNADPACRAPRVWEVMHPSPPPETASYHSDPRLFKTDSELKWLDILMPDFKKAHMIDARLPQECIAIMGHTFMSYVFESMYFVSSYRRWHEDQNKLPAYEFHRQFLQHLQWRCPGSHWLLKAPSHLLGLDALFQVYPDAGIIMTHRDPLKVLASCASFTDVLRAPFTAHLDRHELGAEVSHRWEKGALLAIAFRRDNADLRGSFFDVRYEDLVRNPLGVVRSIYEHFELVLTPEAERAMRQFLAENPQNKNGVHSYSLETYGLRRDTERNRFQFYTDHFGIKPE